MTVSVSDLNALRDGHPHIAKIYMSVFKPAIVYCGTVSGSPAYGARSITVVDVSGNIANIEAGMTVAVGTSCGDFSISKRRYRSRVGQVLTLDENPITWVAGQYITVYENWELWSIFQYIDPTTYEFFKDYDIAYTDENEFPPPVAIAGSHRSKFLDGYSVSFDLDASASYAIASGATIASYLWECPGGNIVNPAVATTVISFVNPGQYWLKLTVTDSNGRSQTTRRVLFVHQRTGTYAPYQNFDIESPLSGEWSRGGWTASVKIHGNATQADIPDGTLVVLWYETYFAGSEYYVGGNNSLFVGYVSKETIRKELDVGSVVFELETINFLLDKTAMRSVSLVSDTTPGTWYEMSNLTMRRAVHHLWKWHSTLLDICDVIMSEDGDLIYAVDDFTNGTLYKMVDVFTYQHGNFSHVCSNRLGILYLEKDINTLTLAERAAIGIDLTVTNADMRGPQDLEISRDPNNRISYVIVSGVAYDGTSTTPIIAQAPGEIPHNFGNSETTFERMILDNQAQANHYVGRVFAISNRELVEIRMPLAGNYMGILDIVPQRWWYLSMNASTNKRGIEFSDRAVPRLINTEINVSVGTLLVDIGVEPEVFGPDGIMADIPLVEPPDDPGDYELPPIPELPPWPELPPIVGCSANPAAPANGPFTTVINAVISSIDPIPYALAILSSYIRMASSTFRTIVLIEGCKYQSTNGGASWSPWLTTDGLVISAYDLATGTKPPVAVNYPVLASDVDGCGWRGGEFAPAVAVATDAYQVKLEPEPLYFNGLDTFEMVDGCSHIELIDAMRWKSLGVTPAQDATQKAYAIAKLTFSSLAPFMNNGGRMIFTYILISGGYAPYGTYGNALYTSKIETHHSENFDAYKIPAPEGLSDGGSTDPFTNVGNVGEAGQVVGSADNHTILGDNYIGLHCQAYAGTSPFETEFQMMNILWRKAGDADQLLMVSRITRIDMTNIRVYNVCFD